MLTEEKHIETHADPINTLTFIEPKQMYVSVC